MERFRILIVEDHFDARNSLVRLLREEFPSTSIDQADSRRQALKFVEESIDNNQPYDLALVDLLLPEDLRGNVDEYAVSFQRGFFEKFWKGRYRTAVILMSAYARNSEVEKYFDVLDKLPDKLYRHLEKQAGHTYRIIQNSRDLLYGESILRRLRGVFQGEQASDSGGLSLYYLPLRDKTTLFADLSADIVEYWPLLLPGIQGEIQKFVSVLPYEDNTSVVVQLPDLDRRAVENFRKQAYMEPRGIFRIYYKVRDSDDGEGWGRDGVVPAELLDGYIDGLTRAWNQLNRIRGSDHPGPENIDVFIMDLTRLHLRWDDTLNMLIGCPFALCDQREIFLPSRSQEADPALIRSRAVIEAAHEVAHIFNRYKLPGRWTSEWSTFDESTAYFVEQRVSPKNPWTLIAAVDWLDRPEKPLFATDIGAPWPYLQYLEGICPGIVDEIWTTAKKGDNLQAWISARLGKTEIEWMTAYFSSAYFAEDLCPGFEGLFSPLRASLHGAMLSHDIPAFRHQSDILNLACRYYRAKAPAEGWLRLRITMSKADLLEKGLSATFVECLPDWKPGKSYTFDRAPDALSLTVEIGNSQIDHWALCVASTSPKADSKPANFEVGITWSSVEP